MDSQIVGMNINQANQGCLYSLRSQFCSIFLSDNSGKGNIDKSQPGEHYKVFKGRCPLIFFRDFTVMTITAIRMKEIVLH